MLVDTHAHLNFKAFDKDVSEVIRRAKKSSVNKIIVPGAKIDSSKKAGQIAEKYPGVYAAVGIHPHHVHEFTENGRNVINTLNRLAKHNKVVAIGEIGLDYYRYKNYPEITRDEISAQKKLFILQMKIAELFNLPVIIHCRNAHDDLFEILDKILTNTKFTHSGVFHCFGGNLIHLNKALEIGFFIGFDGNITYGNLRLRELVKATPLHRIVLESDSPYLAPVPCRGSRNEPANLPYIASCVSDIHNRNLEEIVKTTTQNAMSLFLL